MNRFALLLALAALPACKPDLKPLREELTRSLAPLEARFQSSAMPPEDERNAPEPWVEAGDVADIRSRMVRSKAAMQQAAALQREEAAATARDFDRGVEAGDKALMLAAAAARTKRLARAQEDLGEEMARLAAERPKLAQAIAAQPEGLRSSLEQKGPFDQATPEGVALRAWFESRNAATEGCPVPGRAPVVPESTWWFAVRDDSASDGARVLAFIDLEAGVHYRKVEVVSRRGRSESWCGPLALRKGDSGPWQAVSAGAPHP